MFRPRSRELCNVVVDERNGKITLGATLRLSLSLNYIIPLASNSAPRSAKYFTLAARKHVRMSRFAGRRAHNVMLIYRTALRKYFDTRSGEIYIFHSPKLIRWSLIIWILPRVNAGVFQPGPQITNTGPIWIHPFAHFVFTSAVRRIRFRDCCEALESVGF